MPGVMPNCAASRGQMLDRSFSLSQLRSAGDSATTTSFVGYSPGMQVYLVRGWVRARVRLGLRSKLGSGFEIGVGG